MEIQAGNKEWPLKPEFKGKNLETEVTAFIAEVFMQAEGNDRSLFTRIVENRGDLSFSGQQLIDLAAEKFLASDDAMAEDANKFQQCCDALISNGVAFHSGVGGASCQQGVSRVTSKRMSRSAAST